MSEVYKNPQLIQIDNTGETKTLDQNELKMLKAQIKALQYTSNVLQGEIVKLKNEELRLSQMAEWAADFDRVVLIAGIVGVIVFSASTSYIIFVRTKSK